VDAWSLQLISFYMGGDVSTYLSIYLAPCAGANYEGHIGVS
jgi:hypothetical protein